MSTAMHIRALHEVSSDDRNAKPVVVDSGAESAGRIFGFCNIGAESFVAHVVVHASLSSGIQSV